MKHLSSKLYPDDVITDIESTGAIGNYKVCWFRVNVTVAEGVGSLCCPKRFALEPLLLLPHHIRFAVHYY